jgi:hypothetical protein
VGAEKPKIVVLIPGIFVPSELGDSLPRHMVT